MRKSLLIIVLFFIFTNAQSAHLGGYSLSLVNIKDANNLPTDNYTFVLRLHYNISFPSPGNFTFKLYSNSSNTLIQNVLLTSVSTTPHNYPAENCLPADNSGSFRTVLYKSAIVDLSSLNDTAGYYLSLSTGCCFSSNINYVNNGPDDIIMRLDFPAVGNQSIYRYNSSPEFITPPRSQLCLGIPTIQKWTATDADGDKIVYSFGQMESVSAVKPFTYTNFSSSSYSVNNPLIGFTKTILDPDSAYLSMHPSLAGGHYIMVKATEFRGNKKIGEVVRLVYVNVAINCASTADKDPVIRFNSNKSLSIKRDTLDVTNLRTYDFFVSDSGSINDSIKVKIDLLNSWTVLDTNSYKWEQLDINNNVIATFRNNLFLNAFKSAKLRLILDPNNASLINTPIRFKLIATDNSCYSGRIDTFIFELVLTRKDSILNTNTSIISSMNNDVSIKLIMSNNYGFTYKWQSDFGNGYKDITSNAKYIGVNTDNIVIKKVDARNDNQLLRCIATGFYNVDTSIDFKLNLIDTCLLTIYDTTFVQIKDTTYKIVYNDIYISKNDTISFQFNNSNSAPNNMSFMSINHFDNARKLEFRTNSLQGLSGYKIEIEDANGLNYYLKNIDNVYLSTPIDNLVTKGKYKVLIKDSTNNIVMVKNLILN